MQRSTALPSAPTLLVRSGDPSPPPPPQPAATPRLQQALAPTAQAPGTVYLTVTKSYVVRHASVKSGGVKKQTCNKASFGIKQSLRREARQQTTPDLSHFF